MVNNLKKILLMLGLVSFIAHSAEHDPALVARPIHNGKQVTPRQQEWIKQLQESCRLKSISHDLARERWDRKFLQIPEDQRSLVLGVLLDEMSK